LPERPIDTAQPLEQITDAILKDAASQASQKPVSTMSTALLLGLVVGLLRQNSNK